MLEYMMFKEEPPEPPRPFSGTPYGSISFPDPSPGVAPVVGQCMAFSEDGKVCAAGHPYANDSKGGVVIMRDNGTAYAITETVTHVDWKAPERWGRYFTLSGNGQTLAVFPTTTLGMIYFFVNDGSKFVFHSKIARGGGTAAAQDNCQQLNYEGDRLVFSVPSFNSNRGFVGFAALESNGAWRVVTSVTYQNVNYYYGWSVTCDRKGENVYFTSCDVIDFGYPKVHSYTFNGTTAVAGPRYDLPVGTSSNYYHTVTCSLDGKRVLAFWPLAGSASAITVLERTASTLVKKSDYKDPAGARIYAPSTMEAGNAILYPTSTGVPYAVATDWTYSKKLAITYGQLPTTVAGAMNGPRAAVAQTAEKIIRFYR